MCTRLHLFTLNLSCHLSDQEHTESRPCRRIVLSAHSAVLSLLSEMDMERVFSVYVAYAVVLRYNMRTLNMS